MTLQRERNDHRAPTPRDRDPLDIGSWVRVEVAAALKGAAKIGGFASFPYTFPD
jgi:hypothetical protein